MSENLKNGKVLLVDDTKANIDLLVAALDDDYRLGVALNGKSAVRHALAHPPDLILLDIMMPEMDGMEVCRVLKAAPETKDVPIIFLTAMDDTTTKSEGFAAGAVDYVTKPFDISEVKARVKTHLALKKAREELKNQNSILEERVQERTKEIVIRLAMAAELRDTDTGMHIMRIRDYTMLLARKLNFPEVECERLGLASVMHDLGKIGIPDAILLKPGKLDAEEWEIMKTHTEIGARILAKSRSELLEAGHAIALYHHERWDGKGYPVGLTAEDIPVEGRIVCLADVFDALTSKRPYKDAWPVERAVEVMRSERGKHFDPELLDMFMDSLDEIEAICKNNLYEKDFSHDMIQQLIMA